MSLPKIGPDIVVDVPTPGTHPPKRPPVLRETWWGVFMPDDLERPLMLFPTRDLSETMATLGHLARYDVRFLPVVLTAEVGIE